MRSAFAAPAVATRLQKVERAVEATYLDKPQAEANQLQAAGAAGVIEALKEVDIACVQVGSLLVVKLTLPDGKHAVFSRTLTSDELNDLNRNQTALQDPGQILEFLKNAGRNQIA